jgi:hypothetical protein
MTAPTYDKERSKEETNELTGIDAAEERRIEEAANRDHIRDLEDQYNAPAARNRNTASDNLSDAEQTNNGQIGNGFRDDDEPAQNGGIGGAIRDKAAQQAKNKVKGMFTKKRVAIGGGIVSFLSIILIMSSGFSAFELVNLRENALGKGNRFTNRVLEKRRAQTFVKTVFDLNNKKSAYGTPEFLKRQKAMKAAFEKQGFKVELGNDGIVKEFSYTDKRGEKRKLNFDLADDIKITNDFFGSKGKNDKFSLEASRAFDKVHASQGGLWRGPGARLVYGAYKFAFFNWLDAKPSEKAKTNRQKFADVFRKSSATESAISAQAAKSKTDLGDGQGKDGETATKVTDTAEVLNGELNKNMSPEEYQKKMLENPALTDSVLGVADKENVGDLVSGTEKAMDSGGFKTEDQLNKLGKGVFKGSFTALLRGFNILGVAQTACEIKGILNFVSNYRNIVLSIELARFAIRILNAADDQKAGIISGTGLNLLMIYLTTPDPNTGKGHTGAGGEQWMFGDTGAKPSRMNRSLYGLGRNNDGILGRINNFVNQIPGINKCSIVNNGFVTVGGYAVGITAAIASGGGITGAEIATMLTMAAMHEIIVQVATPMLIKAGAHMIANGYESGEMAGDMFSSGMGSLQGMVNGATGMRPSTNAQIVAMGPEVEMYQRAEIADQSVFERYFSPSNSDSLATHVAMAMPTSLRGAAISFSSGITGLMQNITSFNTIGSLIMPGSTKRALAIESGCTDPQVKALNIATDPFCSPIMANAPELSMNETEKILTAAQQIDDKGNPTDTKAPGSDKSFNDYIALCFSGRPGILYNPHPDQEGNDSFTDNTCTEHGPALPGDNVGRYDRFANWYGFLNDRTSLEEQAGLSTVTTSDTTFTKTIN